MSAPSQPPRRRLVITFDDQAPPKFVPPPPPVPIAGPGGGSGLPLGSRGLRFLSRTIDGIPKWLVFLAFALLGGVVLLGALSTADCDWDTQGGATDYECTTGLMNASSVGFSALNVLVLAGYFAGVLLNCVLTVRSGHRNGQTLGRQMLNLRLVRVDRSPIGWETVLNREVLFPFALFLPLGLGLFVDALWPFFDPRKRRLVDVWCKTEVVILAEIAPPTGPPFGGPMAPPPPWPPQR